MQSKRPSGLPQSAFKELTRLLHTMQLSKRHQSLSREFQSPQYLKITMNYRSSICISRDTALA